MNESLAATAVDQILQRIYGEYLEMPGLRLTCAQAQRLWALDAQTCVESLERLATGGFLYRRGDGTYARRTEGASLPLARMLKVSGGAAGRPAAPRAARK